MATIPAGEFESKCLEFVEKVAADGEPVVITKGGLAVAKLVPMESELKPRVELFGAMRGSGKILGDIISPLENEWDACK